MSMASTPSAYSSVATLPSLPTSICFLRRTPMNHLRSGLVLLVFAWFLSPVSVLGQKITSSIVGLVTDASGSAVPGAQITVTNEGTRISIEAATDSTGNYAVHNLPAGAY